MAIYRNISMAFWTDTKVADDFTPEDKYFYLYILTNPHTNLCGCYEISIKQMANETGYNIDTITRLLDRFSKIYKILEYSSETKELLILNWYKYNWTASPKLDKPLLRDIKSIKFDKFRDYVGGIFNEREPEIPYVYGIDTTVSVSVTDTVSDTVSDTEKENEKKEKPTRHKYGEYNNVLLTDADFEKLQAEFPQDWQQRIERLSEYIASSGKKYKDHLATIRSWARKDKEEQKNSGEKSAAPPKTEGKFKGILY